MMFKDVIEIQKKIQELVLNEVEGSRSENGLVWINSEINLGLNFLSGINLFYQYNLLFPDLN